MPKAGEATSITWGAQFRTVALALRHHRHGQRAETRIMRSLTDIGQLAGWTAFDAGNHGLAQRYFFTALQLARECGYDPMAAHITADLAFQAASCGNASDAVRLGEAAVELAATAPPKVRASVRSRAAYGHAVAGDMAAFERSYRTALDDVVRAGAAEPGWMYFLTPGHLDAQAGYALIHAGTLAHRTDTTTARSLLRPGQRLLRTGAHDRGFVDAAQRRALFEGAWLAVAAAACGNTEAACEHGRIAVTRTRTVRSTRSLDVLKLLAFRLRRSRRNEYVRDFLPELETAVIGQAR